MIDTLADVLFV